MADSVNSVVDEAAVERHEARRPQPVLVHLADAAYRFAYRPDLYLCHLAFSRLAAPGMGRGAGAYRYRACARDSG